MGLQAALPVLLAPQNTKGPSVLHKCSQNSCCCWHLDCRHSFCDAPCVTASQSSLRLPGVVVLPTVWPILLSFLFLQCHGAFFVTGGPTSAALRTHSGGGRFLMEAFMRSFRPLQLHVELISAVTQHQGSLSYLAVVASQQTRVGSKQVSRLEKHLAVGICWLR